MASSDITSFDGNSTPSTVSSPQPAPAPAMFVASSVVDPTVSAGGTTHLISPMST